MSDPPSPISPVPTRKMSDILRSPPDRLPTSPRLSLTLGLHTELKSPRFAKPFVEEDYREAFNMFDENKDGKLSRQELIKVMQNMYSDTSEDEIDRIMEAADTDGDGFINFREFANLLRDHAPHDDSEVIRQAFRLIDLEGAGRFNSRQLKRFMISLGAKTTDAYAEDVIRELDSNGDGEVEYSDFLRVMKGL